MPEARGAARLRAVVDDDVEHFFEHQVDPVASHMAAFTHEDPTDRVAFGRHWARVRADPDILVRTVDLDGEVAGHVVSYLWGGRRAVGYWIARRFWGRGLATLALRLLLDELVERPLIALVAHDNLRSQRVLARAGFVLESSRRAFANARGAEIDEQVWMLEDPT